MSCKRQFNETELACIEELAAHGFIAGEIAEVIADPNNAEDYCNIRSALHNDKSCAYLYYRKGFLQSQLKLRQRIFLDAQHGSSPAQTLAAKILDEAEYQMFD